MPNDVKNLYQMEKVTPAETTTYSAKIGLMYASDYFYAANPVYWNMSLYDISVEDTNWIWGAENKYMGKTDWTISYNTDRENDAISIGAGQMVTSNDVDTTWQFGIRPCFYLNSSVMHISGTGTPTDPYRIA